MGVQQKMKMQTSASRKQTVSRAGNKQAMFHCTWQDCGCGHADHRYCVVSGETKPLALDSPKPKPRSKTGRNAAAVNVEATQEHDIDSTRRRVRPDQHTGGCRCWCDFAVNMTLESFPAMIGCHQRWRCVAVAFVAGYRGAQHLGGTPTNQHYGLKNRKEKSLAWHAAMNERTTRNRPARFRFPARLVTTSGTTFGADTQYNSFMSAPVGGTVGAHEPSDF